MLPCPNPLNVVVLGILLSVCGSIMEPELSFTDVNDGVEDEGAIGSDQSSLPGADVVTGAVDPNITVDPVCNVFPRGGKVDVDFHGIGGIVASLAEIDEVEKISLVNTASSDPELGLNDCTGFVASDEEPAAGNPKLITFRVDEDEGSFEDSLFDGVIDGGVSAGIPKFIFGAENIGIGGGGSIFATDEKPIVLVMVCLESDSGAPNGWKDTTEEGAVLLVVAADVTPNENPPEPMLPGAVGADGTRAKLGVFEGFAISFETPSVGIPPIVAGVPIGFSQATHFVTFFSLSTKQT